MTGRLKGIPFTMHYSISAYNKIYSGSYNFQLKFSKSVQHLLNIGFPLLW